MDNPDPLVGEYLQARVVRDQAQANLDEIQTRLVKQMEADQRKSYRWQANGRAFAVTYVQSHTYTVDERGLRKALTAKTYDKYTKKVLDRRAMEKALDTGEIDRMTVAPFVTEKPNKPHLSLHEKEVSDG